MRLSRNYSPAKVVEEILESLLEKEESEYVVESNAFKGTRVQGFEFLVYDDAAEDFVSWYVYEHKGSDDICVTESTASSWRDVTEAEWKETRSFRADEHNLAAKYVLKRIVATVK